MLCTPSSLLRALQCPQSQPCPAAGTGSDPALGRTEQKISEICPRSMWNLAQQEPEPPQAPTQCLIYVELTYFFEGEQKNL